MAMAPRAWGHGGWSEVAKAKKGGAETAKPQGGAATPAGRGEVARPAGRGEAATFAGRGEAATPAGRGRGGGDEAAEAGIKPARGGLCLATKPTEPAEPSVHPAAAD